MVKARHPGMAGATVIRGDTGYASGVHNGLQTPARRFIEILDSEDKANAFLDVLDQFLAGGVVMMEKVEMLRFSRNPKAD